MIRSKNLVDGVMMNGIFIAVNVDMLDFHSNVYHRLKLNDRLLVKETC